jgi:hypothetical protein
MDRSTYSVDGPPERRLTSSCTAVVAEYGSARLHGTSISPHADSAIEFGMLTAPINGQYTWNTYLRVYLPSRYKAWSALLPCVL